MGKQLLLFIIVLAALAATIVVVTPYLTDAPLANWIVGSLMLATLAVFAWMQRVPSARFVTSYLLSVVLKLLVGGGFVFAILASDQAHADAHAILFMVTYFLATAAEVAFLFKRFQG